jgi:hypothetical protein
MIIPNRILPGLRKVLDRSCTEKQNTFYVKYFFPTKKSCHLENDYKKRERIRQAKEILNYHQHSKCHLIFAFYFLEITSPKWYSRHAMHSYNCDGKLTITAEKH